MDATARASARAKAAWQDESRLAMIVAWVAAAIACVVAFVVPVGYFALAKEGELREATVAARLHAAFVTQVIQASIGDWRTDVSGLIESDLAPSTLPEHRVILDRAGRTVASTGPVPSGPEIRSRAPLLGRDGLVGEVMIVRSTSPLLLRTALIALLSVGLGVAIFGSLKVLPLRALRRTLDALKLREARAREEAESNLRLVFEHSFEGILILSSDDRIRSCNQAAATMLGDQEAHLHGVALAHLFERSGTADDGGRFPLGQFETLARRPGGVTFPVEVTISASGLHEAPHRIAILRDISERKQAEARLSQMANFDSLTGLPNRSQFRDCLGEAMARARGSRRVMALMFLDIDRFKTINDSLGHDFGDRLLVEVARRLANCVRTVGEPLRDTDAKGESAAREGDAIVAPHARHVAHASPGTVAAAGVPRCAVYRLGGDEFTVLIEDLAGPGIAALVARRILAALAEPVLIGEHELFISASIGITMYPDEETDLDGLVRQADMAMYRSKEIGRDTYSFYNAELNAAATERHRLETGLRQAFERGQFQLVYQPKADLATGRVSGVEALLRLHVPGQPPVSPEKFIPIMEETGLIVPVGAWVIRDACRQMVSWDRIGLPPINLAVNLSARQFRQQDLIEQIAAALDQSGLAPERLEIELTESALIEDSEAVTRIMASLGRLGVAVAIDDFGTGHSSLSYLKRFDVDTLKIDRSFVRDTPDDPEDNAIAVAVIALGHGLGLKVVAEGVENERQAAFLRAQGCDEIQGYLLTPPLPPEEFATWLRTRPEVAGAFASEVPGSFPREVAAAPPRGAAEAQVTSPSSRALI
jgi:PAS domain S-box-containing protein